MVEPGQAVHFIVQAPGSCNPAGTVLPHQRYTALRLHFPTGAVSLSGLHPLLCTPHVFTSFQVPQPAPPAPGTTPSLQAKVEAPATATAGSTLHFVVVLSNPSGVAVHFEACPVYTEGLYVVNPDARSEVTFRLTCAGARSIAGHSQVPFEMVVPVPSATGAAKLYWEIDPDGPAAGSVVMVTASMASPPQGSFAPGYITQVAKSQQILVLVHCVGLWSSKSVARCDDYRLAHSRAGTLRWAAVPIPGTASLGDNQIDLAALGNKVWVTFDLPSGATPPEILVSKEGEPSLREIPSPRLVSVSTCGLTPTSASALWAVCPTGMLESMLYSSDGGRHFRGFWEAAGTSGTALDPISTSAAYLYTGIGPGPAGTLEITTGAGRHFSAVSKLPFAPAALHALVFVSHDEGYALGEVAPGGDVEREFPVLLYTSDGGKHWDHVRIPSSLR